MSGQFALAPQPSFRLIPSRFPPIGLFDTVATAADLAAVMELAGWTNDRLVKERLARLPEDQWVFGRANASVVMAAFLHAAPDGGRFNGPDLGAWYAAESVRTAAAEVGHHLRREAVATRVDRLARTFRTYTARLDGSYLDLAGSRNAMPDILAPDSYRASQPFGEALRAKGGDGIRYASLRRRDGVNVAAFRPKNVQDVVQADHYEIAVMAASRRIEVVKLKA